MSDLIHSSHGIYHAIPLSVTAFVSIPATSLFGPAASAFFIIASAFVLCVALINFTAETGVQARLSEVQV
jgi:hypothetical protein